MASKIQLKRSIGSTLAGSDNLYPGELAYTEGLETVSIGSAAYKTITAGDFVVGTTYTIVAATGTTQAQWVAAGVPTETTAIDGTVFTATAIGAGTGTAGAHNIAAAEHIIAGQAYTDMLVPETAAGPASIILREDTESTGGTDSITLTVPGEIDTSMTLTLPGTVGVQHSILTASDATGALVWDRTLNIDTLDTSGAVNLNLDTDATNATTGALVVDGGAAIAKKLYVGDAVGITGALTASAAVTVGTTLGVTGATTVAGLSASGDVSIAGNLEVTGTTITIDSSDVVVKDKTLVLGVAGGMEEATYQQSGTTVTVTSTDHGFNSTEFVYISGAAEPGTPITDGVYVVTELTDDTFTFVSTTDSVTSDTAIFHSSDDVTTGTANGSGIVVPAGATMASIKYESTTNDWGISENIDIASGKVIKFANAEKLSATEYGGNAATVTLNADLSGDITSSGSNATAIAAGVIVDADVSASAAIAYSKLGTIPTWNQNTTGSSGSTTGSSASTTGNAATATKLETARNIGGVSFDGSAAINLPGVNAAGDQDTSGNATSATSAATLTTARAIGGVDFDGSAAITLPGVNSAGNQSTSSTAAGLSVTLIATSGGTGHSAYAVGDVLYASSTTAVSKLTAGTEGQLFMMGATVPEWSDIDGGSY